MEKKKLISMTDFVLKEYTLPSTHKKGLKNCYQYANFLKRKLELGMFIPCDEEGNVLEEPEKDKKGNYIAYSGDTCIYIEQYQEAKERVLFEMFDAEITLTKKGAIKIVVGENETILIDCAIEQLTEYNLTLTPNATKQIQ